MSSLQIRDIPADLLEKLRMIAANERRSVNAQVIVLLSEAVRDKVEPETVKSLLESSKAIRLAARGKKRKFDSTELIRRARAERRA